jgi:hypothetical protein
MIDDAENLEFATSAWTAAGRLDFTDAPSSDADVVIAVDGPRRSTTTSPASPPDRVAGSVEDDDAAGDVSCLHVVEAFVDLLE